MNASSVTEKEAPHSTTNVALYFASIIVLLPQYDSIVDDWMLTGQQVHFIAGFEVLTETEANLALELR